MTVSIPSKTLEKFTTFGDLLRFLRRRVGLTQTELAIAVGYGHTQISRLEQNLRLPDIPTIETQFISALGLEDEPKAVARLLDLAANIRREDAPALGLCPYKGLNYFDEADADLFMGREALTAKLVNRVLSLTSNGQSNENRFLGIVGASGSGKSSLVRAGLVPALRWNQASTNWQIHILTPTAYPLESLAASLTLEDPSVTATTRLVEDLARDLRTLQIFAKRKLGSKNGPHLLLVVDQFEELFALCRSEDERASFIGNLLTASSETDGPFILVITLRADFYAHCASYPQLREALAQHQEYIGAMNDEELKRAIEEPAQRGRWEFEPGLIDLLLHDVGHEPGALPLLSHALLETWQRRRGRKMTLSGYASSGGVRGAITETAETVFTDQFTHEQQAIARRIFLRLAELSDETSTADTRRRATFNELILKPEEAATTHAVLKALADARLITTSEDSAEVAHEALIREWPTLRSWLEDNRESLRLHRQLTEAAQEWLMMAHEPDMLYRGARLAQAREWASSHDAEMNALESEFLQASIESSERELAEKEAQRQRELVAAKELAETQRQAASRLQIRNRVITAVGSIAFILAFLAGMFGMQSNRNAQQAEANFANAEAQRLAALANNLLQQGGNTELIALLSLRSMKTQYTPQGDAALVGAAGLDYPLQVFTAADRINSIDYSPDGRYILTGGEDNTARLWDIQTGHEIRQFIGHTNAIGNVAFSPDGKYILTGSADHTVRLWDTATGQELQLISLSEPALVVTISPDGKYVATGSFDKIARLWDTHTGEEIREFVGHTDWVYRLDYSPDGKYLLTGSLDHTVRLWDVSRGEEVRRFLGIGGAYSPGGQQIATAGADSIIRLYDAETGEEVRQFIGHTGFVDGVTFSPNEENLISAADDATVRLWDVSTGQEVRRFAGEEIATFSPDGKYILTGSADGAARLWSIQAHPELPIFDHTAGVNGVAFSPNGQFAVTGGMDSVARLWNIATREKLRDLIGHTNIINYGVAFSPDGKYILTGSADYTVRLWNAVTGQELHTFATEDGVNSVAFSPDGKYILAGSNDQMAWLWDAVTGQLLRQLDSGGDGTNWIQRAVFSTDGKYVATAGVDGTARLWDAATGKQLRQFTTPEGGLKSVMFSQDGKYILTGGLVVQLWNVDTGQELRQFNHEVWTAAFSPDDMYVATAGLDGTARLWDAQTGQELRRLIGHDAGVEDVDFSPDGKYLLTGSNDGTAILWDVDYHITMAKLCSRLLRDFTEEERKQFNISDTTPTCPKP